MVAAAFARSPRGAELPVVFPGAAVAFGAVPVLVPVGAAPTEDGEDGAPEALGAPEAAVPLAFAVAVDAALTSV